MGDFVDRDSRIPRFRFVDFVRETRHLFVSADDDPSM
jgi:hypothetical protein